MKTVKIQRKIKLKGNGKANLIVNSMHQAALRIQKMPEAVRPLYLADASFRKDADAVLTALEAVQ